MTDRAPAALVSTKVEEALIFRMKQEAMQKCKQEARAYAECCKTRSISIAWACRQQFGNLNSCVAQQGCFSQSISLGAVYVPQVLHCCSTGDRTLKELKSRWIAAGRPELPDWEALFDGL
ncbi:TPA: hypothetical protein ACH3X1_003649 [Trebouxia sp. C0004]